MLFYVWNAIGYAVENALVHVSFSIGKYQINNPNLTFSEMVSSKGVKLSLRLLQWTLPSYQQHHRVGSRGPGPLSCVLFIIIHSALPATDLSHLKGKAAWTGPLSSNHFPDRHFLGIVVKELCG